MQYRRFGRTELEMPVFSCGGMRYQQSWQTISAAEVDPDNQRNLEYTIHKAVSLGINHIETARGYGSSELQLGKVLPRFPRQNLIVQTKVVPSEDPQKFLETFEQSFDFLQLDYVDLLGIHGINTPEILEWCTRPGGCLSVARQLQQEGRVRFVGFSTHGPTEVIVDTIKTGEFDYVNLHWYYIFQNNWPAIEAAAEQDMGVFIISPSDKGGHLYNPPDKLSKLCAPLSPMMFNDLFCLSHPQVHTLSLGAARPTDFDEHLKVLPLLGEAQPHLNPILQRLETAAIEALGKEWYLNWSQGLPQPSETPGGLNIPIMLWLYNLVKAYDLVEFGQARYNLLGNGGHWFPGKKAYELEKLDLKACLQQSPYAEKIPALLQEIHDLLEAGDRQRLSSV
ncbi:MAG: aldo/keto reductase [Prochlorotrichaceae cyanobacterium]